MAQKTQTPGSSDPSMSNGPACLPEVLCSASSDASAQPAACMLQNLPGLMPSDVEGSDMLVLPPQVKSRLRGGVSAPCSRHGAEMSVEQLRFQRHMVLTPLEMSK